MMSTATVEPVSNGRARTVLPLRDGPEPAAGVQHHHAPIAIVTIPNGALPIVRDLRALFRPLTGSQI